MVHRGRSLITIASMTQSQPRVSRIFVTQHKFLPRAQFPLSFYPAVPFQRCVSHPPSRKSVFHIDPVHFRSSKRTARFESIIYWRAGISSLEWQEFPYGTPVNMQACTIRGNYSRNRVSSCLVSQTAVAAASDRNAATIELASAVFSPWGGQVSSIRLPISISPIARLRISFKVPCNCVLFVLLYISLFFPHYISTYGYARRPVANSVWYHEAGMYEEFLFVLLIECPEVRSYPRSFHVSFVRARKVSITVSTWTESAPFLV